MGMTMYKRYTTTFVAERQRVCACVRASVAIVIRGVIRDRNVMSVGASSSMEPPPLDTDPESTSQGDDDEPSPVNSVALERMDARIRDLIDRDFDMLKRIVRLENDVATLLNLLNHVGTVLTDLARPHWPPPPPSPPPSPPPGSPPPSDDDEAIAERTH